MGLKVEYGDFQTPASLADRVCRLLLGLGIRPASVVEPTCGRGAFLHAAETVFADSARTFRGYEINGGHVAAARATLSKAEVYEDDFFTADWSTRLERSESPILVLGNPPWVTNSALGAMGGSNLPQKANQERRRGIDAIMGSSNFDISEWMIRHLLECLSGRPAVVAMLCKTAVARRVLSFAWRASLGIGESAIYRIDAQTHFGAAVDACLLVCRLDKGSGRTECEAYEGLCREKPAKPFGLLAGQLVSDVKAFSELARLHCQERSMWRSGIKHDCAKVMELTADRNGTYVNGFGERLQLEPEFLYPLLKSSDVARGRKPSRWLVVPQKRVGQPTDRIEARAPQTWRYLSTYSDVLAARRSVIFRRKPPFSVFGVGEYTFARWKVAISGLYKEFSFRSVGPVGDKPTVLDDTCYFVPCRSERQARQLVRALHAADVQRFLASLVFWDAKRPITARLLGNLDLQEVGGLAVPQRTLFDRPTRWRKR